jgi:hypothetical protein
VLTLLRHLLHSLHRAPRVVAHAPQHSTAAPTPASATVAPTPSVRTPLIPFATQTPDTLSASDRQAIRDWLGLPATHLVLSLVESTHPGRNLPALLPKSEADKDAAVCLLNRIRGWETYRNTLLHLLTPRPDTADISETYQSRVIRGAPAPRVDGDLRAPSGGRI